MAESKLIFSSADFLPKPGMGASSPPLKKEKVGFVMLNPDKRDDLPNKGDIFYNIISKTLLEDIPQNKALRKTGTWSILLFTVSLFA